MILDKNSIFKAATLLGVSSLLSRLLGLYRDRLFATNFGAGDVLDTYYAAFRLPDLLYNLLILGTLSVAFIPVFTEYLLKDKEEANKVGNTILTLTFVIVGLLCLILFAFVPQITHLIAPGFEGQKYVDTVEVTKILLLSPLIFSVSNVFSSLLNSYKRFLSVAIAPILYNLGIILGIVYLFPSFGIKGLAYGVLIGALAHLAIQVPATLGAGFSIRPNLNVGHQAVKKIAKLFLPRIIGVDPMLISLLIASIVGSTLSSGTIAIINLANNLQAVPVGIFALSIVVAAFPNLSESYAKKDNEEFKNTFVKTLLHILYFTIPIAILLILLRAQIVRVIFGAGEFNWEDTKLTANTLGIFALSIFAQGLSPFFSRTFYARHNTIIPVAVGLFTLLLNAVLSYFLGRSYGVLGLASGFSIASILNALILYIILRKEVPGVKESVIIGVASKIVFASAVMSFVTYITLNVYAKFFVLDTFLSVLAQGLVAGGLGIMVFFLITIRLGVKESDFALKVVKSKIFG